MGNKLEKKIIYGYPFMAGKIKSSRSGALHSSVGTGGRVLLWAEPETYEELDMLLSLLYKEGVPYKILGNCTNVLFPDDRYEKCVIRLRQGAFTKLESDKEYITAGCGAGVNRLLAEALNNGLSGLEGLVGIPGTLGGAIRGNASSLSSISDSLVSATVLHKRGNAVIMKKEEMGFAYRTSAVGDDDIILSGTFKLRPGDRKAIFSALKKNFMDKYRKQPLGEPSLGCVFRNPVSGEYSSGELLDRAGMKGVRCGGAMVSDKHANFIINKGSASSGDFISLMDIMKKAVKDKFSIELIPEVEILA